MRDRTSPAPFAKLIDAAPLRLKVPGDAAPAVARDALPTIRVEQRQSPRASLPRRGAIQVCQSLPALHRADAPGGILVLDVSRRGLRFLFDEQLFPGEQLRIWLTETELQGEVIRCRRLGPSCYEVGIRLADPLAPTLVRQLLTEADDGDCPRAK